MLEKESMENRTPYWNGEGQGVRVGACLVGLKLDV